MTIARHRQVESSGGSSSPTRKRGPVRRVVRLVVAVLVLLALYLGATFVQVLWASRWDEADEAHDWAEAAIVLGAAQYNGRPSEVFQRRLDHALELYRDNIVPTIVVTGGAAEGDRYTEAYSGLTYLIKQGVPDEDLIVVDDGSSTWESLAATGRVLRAQGIDQVVLVSDSYHSLRLKGIASEVGLQAKVSPTTSGTPLRQVARETAAVSIGRIVGYRRMLNWMGG